MVTTGETDVAGIPVVRVEDGRLLVKNLVIDDREVVEYFAAVQDLAVGLAEALRVGVRVLQIAATTGDVEMVKREFDSMTGTLQTNVDKLLQGAQERLAERLTKFSTEDLKKSLDGHRDEVNKELVRLFGPDSASSVQRQVDKLLEEQAKLHRQGLAAVLERTSDPENPLAKLREELKGKVDETAKEIRDLRDKVLEIVGQEKGVAIEREKGTAKGRTYQEVVFEHVSEGARHFGDTAIYVADQPGLKGQAKAGDVVVEINPQETSDSALQMVFEAKNQAGISIPRLLKELEEAKENRAAASAVAVFSSPAIVPTGVGLWRDYPGRRFVCVLDSETPEPVMLEFTYRCARFEALRAIAPTERRLDVAAVRGVIQSVRTRVGALQQMKTKLTGASGAIDEVQRLIDNHRDGIRHDLEGFDRLLAAGVENSQEASP